MQLNAYLLVVNHAKDEGLKSVQQFSHLNGRKFPVFNVRCSKNQFEPEEAKDVAGRGGGVSWRFWPGYTTGDFGDTLFLCGFKSSEKPVSWAEASPQQAECLAAVVR
ncbi:hypothetical protein FC99_GL000686 [Levilactobacillus koreensis JCM 16448]|uniref:Uncharacterized protein n=1 Tax=Levilactobacillus koreensis TaxID=637971 RepID=A0AAC8UT56_9LACO|nr:hypothetical protein [Levilactobacillus koreensis]AKP63575.1 hypothetical protein ABN16_00175 [Levilactobacillus koreensis]KRK88052.1 hypothetical protein FC99_GL000686 [Levilactobacillus koreensis JCM 16448]